MSDPELRTAVIAGASGYIGQHLVRALIARGVDVRTIGRGTSSDASWDEPAGLVDVLEGADLLVNLAGRSVSCRYTKRNADAIMSSRTETTAALGRALSVATQPPELWINSSTGTIYRESRDRPMDEATGDLGTGFSVGVARAWEHELFSAPTSIRKVALRMSIVLGAGGGALNPFINLARMGFGGPMGDGDQRFSWVHVDDVVAAITYVFEHPEISGPVNRRRARGRDQRRDDASGADRARPILGHTPACVGSRGRRPHHPYRDRARPQESLGRLASAPGVGVRVRLPVTGRRARPDRRSHPARPAAGRLGLTGAD